MRRNELAHILRAAARIVGDPDILVIGSQSILGTFWEDELPAEAWLSVEADVAFFDDPEALKADQVDGAIGELSSFHQTFAYYARAWRSVPSSSPVVGVTGWPVRQRLRRPCDPHVPGPPRPRRLQARRPPGEGLRILVALIEAGLVEFDTLLERAAILPDDHGIAGRRYRLPRTACRADPPHRRGPAAASLRR